ncbi:hypothetical protein GN956_G1254 [Arapaima gigas]
MNRGNEEEEEEEEEDDDDDDDEDDDGNGNWNENKDKDRIAPVEVEIVWHSATCPLRSPSACRKEGYRGPEDLLLLQGVLHPLRLCVKP